MKTMPISGIMVKNFRTLSSSESVRSATQIMKKTKVDYLLVEEEGAIEGAVTSRSLLDYPPLRLILDCPTEPVAVISEEASLEDAVTVVKNEDVNYLVVMDGRDSPVGVVDRQTIISSLWQQLEKSKKSFHNIVEKNADGIVITDNEGFVRYLNPAAEFLFRCKAENMIGELLGFPLGTDKPVEIDIIRRSGEPGIAEMRVVETEWEGEKAFLAMLRDITEHKQVEETQRKLEAEKLIVEELKKIDRIKNEFVSTVTHELRTPMTPLKSVLEMFLDGSLGEVTPKQKDYLEMMARNVNRLATFTTDVLSLARVESGKYNLHPRQITLLSLVESTLEILGRKIEENKAFIALDVYEEVHVFADPDAVGQVLANLITNAMVHNDPDVAISVSSRRFDDDLIEVSIADNGHGIAEEHIEKIFERFYQADRKDGPGYQGTGLGLPLCKGLVEAMGGQIMVKSKINEGTTFKLTLPASQPPEKNEKEEQ